MNALVALQEAVQSVARVLHRFASGWKSARLRELEEKRAQLERELTEGTGYREWRDAYLRAWDPSRVKHDNHAHFSHAEQRTFRHPVVKIEDE